jgi:hypothetical protein
MKKDDLFPATFDMFVFSVWGPYALFFTLRNTHSSWQLAPPVCFFLNYILWIAHGYSYHKSLTTALKQLLLISAVYLPFVLVISVWGM